MTSDRAGLTVADKPFTQRQRRGLCHQSGYGHRPVNAWGDGDLPAPWAEGDLVRLLDGSHNDRVTREDYGMGTGYFVVSCAFSIDDGDAWYFRVTNNKERGSDRLHVAYADRSTWEDDIDWMSDFILIDTADPEGLAERKAMLAAGWSCPEAWVPCPTCGGYGRVR